LGILVTHRTVRRNGAPFERRRSGPAEFPTGGARFEVEPLVYVNPQEGVSAIVVLITVSINPMASVTIFIAHTHAIRAVMVGPFTGGMAIIPIIVTDNAPTPIPVSVAASLELMRRGRGQAYVKEHTGKGRSAECCS
jgi:hypothetical protein